MSKTAVVSVLPKCDVCADGKTEALYDAKTILGPWANLCAPHFKVYGCGLGTGVGQRLQVAV